MMNAQGVFLIFIVFWGRRFFFPLPTPSPLPLTRPISSSLWEFQHGAFVSKNIHAPKENTCTAGYPPASPLHHNFALSKKWVLMLS